MGENDPDQLKLPLDMEPIELARARSNLHVLGRYFVAGFRRLLTPINLVWLSFAVLTIAAGGSLIKYIGAISENRFPSSSVLSVGMLYPERDVAFYASRTPKLTLVPIPDDDSAASLL